MCRKRLNIIKSGAGNAASEESQIIMVDSRID